MKPILKKYFKTIVLIWAGCFVSLLLLHILILSPQKKTQKNIDTQLADKKRLYNMAIEAAKEETKARLEEQNEPLRSRLKDFVIDFGDLANLKLDIRQIANEKKLAAFQIKSADYRANSSEPDYENISENHIDITFMGTFNQFAHFLNALERHRPVVFVDKFAIARARQEGLSHQIKLNLAVFVRKQQDT